MKSVSLLCHLGLALSCLTTAVNGNLFDAMRRHQARVEKVQQRQQSNEVSRGVVKREDGPTISFANPAAEKFFVDGTKIPDGACSELFLCGRLLKGFVLG
jgi:carboxypeptidase D